MTVQTEQFPPLSDIPYKRFLDVVARIPPGQVIPYVPDQQQRLAAEGVEPIQASALYSDPVCQDSVGEFKQDVRN